MTERYLPDADYNRLVAALLNAQPCPIAGKVTADQIKLALGEAGDIWPEHSRCEESCS